MRQRRNQIPENILIPWTVLYKDYEELRNKCGIYIIKNKVNDKFYVGSSKQLLKRLQEHRCRFKKKDGINKYIQNAYDKYGEENFEYSIIEYCEICDRLDREQYYLTLLEPEYNLSLQVVANKGLPRSEEAKIKSSISNKNLVNLGIVKAKKAYIYNIDDYTLCKVCSSLKDARKILKITSGSNLDKFIFKNKYIIREYKFETKEDLVNHIWEKVKFPRCKQYIIIEKENKIKYYQDIVSCAKDNNISSSLLYTHKNANKKNPLLLSKWH